MIDRVLAIFVKQRRLSAAFAGDHDLVRGREGFTAEPGIRLAVVGDAELDIVFQEGVEDRVGNLVADLVGMPLGDGLAGEQVAFT